MAKKSENEPMNLTFAYDLDIGFYRFVLIVHAKFHQAECNGS